MLGNLMVGDNRQYRKKEDSEPNKLTPSQAARESHTAKESESESDSER